MNWWNTLSNYEQVVIISTSIPVLFVVIVSGLAVSHARREKRERRLLEAAVEAEPLAPPEAYEAGTFTSEELQQIDPDPSRPFAPTREQIERINREAIAYNMRAVWGDKGGSDEPIGRY